MDKKTKIVDLRLVLYSIGAVGAFIVLLVLSTASLGWFTGGSPVQGYADNFAGADSAFELASANKSGSYDGFLSVPDGEASSGIVTEDGTPIDLKLSGNGNSEIRWLMTDESNFGNMDENGIQPGSHGKLTFYVVAKENANLNLTFSLDMVSYDGAAEEISDLNPDNSKHIIPKTEAPAKLAKGHILFFEKYYDQSGVYSSRIADSFTFTQPDAKKDTAYKVEVYWVWPLLIDQLVLPQNDPILRARGYERLTENSESIITAEDSESFFDGSIDGLSEMLTNMKNGSANIGFYGDYYDLLNAKWNEADQIIGTNVGYVELILTADINYADAS